MKDAKDPGTVDLLGPVVGIIPVPDAEVGRALQFLSGPRASDTMRRIAHLLQRLYVCNRDQAMVIRSYQQDEGILRKQVKQEALKL